MEKKHRAGFKLNKIISKKRQRNGNVTASAASNGVLGTHESNVNDAGMRELEMSRPRPDSAQKHEKKGLSSLQERLKAQLQSADFRMLNETLYTRTGAEAKALLDKQPHLFRAYHAGYVRQVRRWPRNPLDDVISYLHTRSGTLIVADLGCGEGRLRHDVKQTVHSFDLVAHEDGITACDISNLPLADSSVDIAVFCLSLMGTNYGQFLVEARRILVSNGMLLIAEVASRFANHDPAQFIRGVEALGFRHDAKHPFSKEANVESKNASANGSKKKKGKSRGGVKRRKGKNVEMRAVEEEKGSQSTERRQQKFKSQGSRERLTKNSKIIASKMSEMVNQDGNASTPPHAQVTPRQQRDRVRPVHRFRATVQKLRRALHGNRGPGPNNKQGVREPQAVAEMPPKNSNAIPQETTYKNSNEPAPINEVPADPEQAEANQDLEDELEIGQEDAAEAAANIADQTDAYRVLGREVWNADGTETTPTDAQLEAELYAEMRAEGYNVSDSNAKVDTVNGLSNSDGLQDVDDVIGDGTGVDLDIDEFSNEERTLEEAAAIDSMLQGDNESIDDVQVDIDDVDDVDENGESHDEDHYMALAQQHLRTAENMLKANADVRP